MIETILFIWVVLPAILIFVAYIYVMGFKAPWHIDLSDSDYRDVYSEDANRIDEVGGPYKVKIKK